MKTHTLRDDPYTQVWTICGYVPLYKSLCGIKEPARTLGKLTCKTCIRIRDISKEDRME